MHNHSFLQFIQRSNPLSLAVCESTKKRIATRLSLAWPSLDQISALVNLVGGPRQESPLLMDKRTRNSQITKREQTDDAIAFFKNSMDEIHVPAYSLPV